MGWGIEINNFKSKLFKRLTFNGLFINRAIKQDLPSILEECNEEMENIKLRLVALVSYTHHTYEEGDDMFSLTDIAVMRVPELLTEYGQAYHKSILAEHAIAYPDEVKQE